MIDMESWNGVRASGVEFWNGVKASHTAVPADRPLPQLLAELEAMLADTDGHVRDELGFSILGSWVIAGFCDEDLVGLGERMATAMGRDVGECGTDSVFGRSFAALTLGLVVERDNIARLLPAATVRRWYTATVAWMAAEQDLRGVTDPVRGVAHAPAHAADVVASLARSRHIDTAHAEVLLEAVTARVAATVGTVLLLSEDERLAYASMALLHRGDLTPQLLTRCLAPLRRLAAVSHRTDLDPRAHARLNAITYLRALYLQLQCGVRTMAWYAEDGHFARPLPDHDSLCAAVLQALRPFSLWFAEDDHPEGTLTTAS